MGNPMQERAPLGSARASGPLRPAGSGPALSHVWAIAAVLLPLVVIAASPLSTVDLAYQIRAGALMLDTHQVLRTDTFTFLSFGRPWLDQQWGAQLVLAWLFRPGGWLGLVVLRAALAAATLTFISLACRAMGATVRLAAWLTLGAALLLLGGLQLRPQLFGLALCAATVWMAATRREHPGRLWIAPALAAAWANLHGSFFLAPVLLGLAWAEDLRLKAPGSRRTGLVALASVAATGLTPFGFRVWDYAWRLSTNPVVRNAVVEWRPPTLGTYSGAVFFASLAAVAALVLKGGRGVPWTSLLTLALFAAIGLSSLRGVFWWATIAPVVVASLTVGPVRARPDPRSRANRAIIVVFVALVAIAFVPWLPYAGRSAPPETRLSYAPAGITAALRTVLEPGQRLFDAQQWGSWFELELPAGLVAVDSRFELLSEGRWRLYRSVSRGEDGWQEQLDRWDVSVVAVARDEQQGLIPKIGTDPAWKLAYEDADGLVFVRR
jgi:hypothetical protein